MSVLTWCHSALPDDSDAFCGMPCEVGGRCWGGVCWEVKWCCSFVDAEWADVMGEHCSSGIWLRCSIYGLTVDWVPCCCIPFTVIIPDSLPVGTLPFPVIVTVIAIVTLFFDGGGPICWCAGRFRPVHPFTFVCVPILFPTIHMFIVIIPSCLFCSGVMEVFHSIWWYLRDADYWYSGDLVMGAECCCLETVTIDVFDTIIYEYKLRRRWSADVVFSIWAGMMVIAGCFIRPFPLLMTVVFILTILFHSIHCWSTVLW